MTSTGKQPSIHGRMVDVFSGRKPDRFPFIDRLELWHKTHSRAGTIPPEFEGLSLTEIHRRVGMGQQKFLAAYGHRLRGVDLTVSFEGELLRQESDPVVEFFPRMAGLAVQDKVGITDIELRTPVGALRLRYQMVEDMVRNGTEAYMMEHLIKDDADYRTVEYVLERAEHVPLYDRLGEEQTRIGDIGFVVPMLGRIPFQQILLEYLGEVKTFYALHDDPRQFERLLAAVDGRMTEALACLAGLPMPYAEFGDNLHGLITNPRLFKTYCLPFYQSYAEVLHGQGKVMGSHTDGDVRPLLHLLAESGLDVAESFSPAPLTACPLEEAWDAWRNGPMIWGGIPSVILEAATPEAEFREFIARLLALAGEGPIVLGVGDQVMGNDLIERVRYVAALVEAGAAG